MPYLKTAFIIACLCLQLPTASQGQTTSRASMPPKGCWTRNLVWTLARQELPLADPTRWTVLAQLPWSAWQTGIPMKTARGDQLLLQVTALDDWRMSLASGPGDVPVLLNRVDVLCTFMHEEPGLRIVLSTRAFR